MYQSWTAIGIAVGDAIEKETKGKTKYININFVILERQRKPYYCDLTINFKKLYPIAKRVKKDDKLFVVGKQFNQTVQLEGRKRKIRDYIEVLNLYILDKYNDDAMDNYEIFTNEDENDESFIDSSKEINPKEIKKII